MKWLPILLPVLLLAGACSEEKRMKAELDLLVATERAFAQRSIDIGNRRAFLEFFADDAILFRPHPVPAREYLLGQPDDESLLTWRPIHAGISRSCDLGYTTGPWEYRAGGAGDSTVLHGHYITVWKKQASGDWNVVIDTGTSNPPPGTDPDNLDGAVSASPGGCAPDGAAGGRTELMHRDRSFSAAAEEKGLVEAMRAFARDDVRIYRRGSTPFPGLNSFAAAHPAKAERITWEPAGATVSRAGDLGFTYGHAVSTFSAGDTHPATHLVYLRIWEKSCRNIWNVVIDVMNPSPPPNNSH